MTSLSAATFSGCIGLKEINIPDGIEKISKGTFRDAQLETLHIGKSVTHIDPQAFFSGEYDQFTGGRKSGRGLRELTVDPENPYFRAAGTSLLSADGKTLLLSLGELGHYVVPERVEVIGASVFKDLTELTGITLPNSLTVIESEAFAGSGLRAVRFGGGLRTIKDNAFFRCEQLTRVVFAEGLEKIAPRAFEGCPSGRLPPTALISCAVITQNRSWISPSAIPGSAPTVRPCTPWKTGRKPSQSSMTKI